MVLEHRVLVLNQILRRIIIDLILQTLIGGDDLKQLVSEIVLGALVIVLDHRGTHLGRRNGKDGADHPVRTAPIAAQPHKVHVLVGDSSEETEDILYLENLGDLGVPCPRINALQAVHPLGCNPCNPVSQIAPGLHGTAAILCLLAAPGNAAALGQNGTPPSLPPALRETLMQLLVNQKLGAAHAHTVQNIHDVREELDEIHGAGKPEMPKMAGAAVVCLATAAASLAIIKNAHTRIKEATNAGLRSIIGSGVGDFHHGTLLNLFWPENTELDTHHGLNIRIGTMNSGGHLSSVIVGGF